MPRDFTVEAFIGLLRGFLDGGYAPLRVRDALGPETPAGRAVILRHDVDRRPDRSVAIALAEAALGVRATYYFRIMPCSFDPGAVKAVARAGHEVGYHYEDLALADGDINAARASFIENLKVLRAEAEVVTACMHGSPASRYDNRKIFEVLAPSEVGLLGEAYLSLAGRGYRYFTDTGRCWNAGGANLRDRLEGSPASPYATTAQILSALRENTFPERAYVTTHPQRWVSGMAGWLLEGAAQAAKNPIKALGRRLRGDR